MRNDNRIRTVCAVIMAVVAAVVALCSSRGEVSSIGDRVVVTGIGVEWNEDGYHLSVQSVEALKTAGSLTEQSDNATEVYRAGGVSVAQALEAFLNETGRSTYILHNRILALRVSQLRERSIFDMLDYFVRNPDGRASVNVVLCRQSPAELLAIPSGNDAIPAEYVSQLLEEGTERGLVWAADLLEVERASSGMMDLALPILTVEEGTPRLDGTAFFREGYLVGELNTRQTTGLLLAAGRIRRCLQTVEDITFQLKNMRTRVTVQSSDEGLVYDFEVSGEAEPVEVGNGSLSNDRRDILLKQVEQQLSENLRVAVGLTVEAGSDPLGLARRATTLSFSQQEASVLLKEAEYRCSVSLRPVKNSDRK